MEKYTLQSSNILSALSLSEGKSCGQFESLISMPGSGYHHTRGNGTNNIHELALNQHIIPRDRPQRKINGYTRLPQVGSDHMIAGEYLRRNDHLLNSNHMIIGDHLRGNDHLVNNDHLTSVASMSKLGGHFEGDSGDFSESQSLKLDYQRPRSHSMGLTVTTALLQPNRSHSKDSVASSSSLADECRLPKKDGGSEEALVEVTCNKFKRLSTRGSESPPSDSPVSHLQEAKGLSRSPPLCDPDVIRKYSFGSQMVSAKRQLSNHDCPPSPHGLPIDLTCKRKKSDAAASSLSSFFLQSPESLGATRRLEEENPVIRENGNESLSILKSVLVGMGRKRSHTLSVCGRQHFRKDSRDPTMGISPRQRVTLAKRNLGPVMGRMSEHLNTITQFLCSQTEFQRLPINDQKSLITDSVHRLLMLYMAESNLQFVVTPVREEDDKSVDDAAVAEEPTMQFVETVQNFISKCQTMNISSSEYALMRTMTLFHAGSRTLENTSAVEKANAEAQKNLQDLIQSSHPTDRLRYSKLLLSLYTLFGINCNMLEALFCRRLISNGSGGRLSQYILSEFLNGTHGDEGR